VALAVALFSVIGPFLLTILGFALILGFIIVG